MVIGSSVIMRFESWLLEPPGFGIVLIGLAYEVITVAKQADGPLFPAILRNCPPYIMGGEENYQCQHSTIYSPCNSSKGT